MTIRWRLFASHLLVVLLAALILGVFVARAMEARYLATVEENLHAQAALLTHLVASDFARGARTPELTARVRAYDRETGLRITLVAIDGRVLADSEFDAATMQNHRDRPEIRQALLSGLGTNLRRSDTLRVNMLYLALRVPAQGTPVGVVRVAVLLHHIESVYAQIRTRVLVFGSIAVVLALLLSLRFSQRLTRAVTDLTRAAQRFAHGDMEAHAHPRGRDELTALAVSFNEMAARLRTMVREIREEKQKAETILARLGEAVLVTDAAGHLTLCNQAAERTFGIVCEQVLWRGIVDITQSHPLDAAFRTALTTGETVAVEVQVRFPRAGILEATVTAVSTDELLGAVAVLHDVTEVRRLEAVRREFVSNASHELQTPVTAIKAMAETLLAEGVEEAAVRTRFLSEIEQQADRLGALVRDLLELAHLESGAATAPSGAVDLAEIVPQVLLSLAPVAAARTITLQSEVPAELYVQAEWSALHRVLSNLIDNAMKYTDPGGHVGVRAQRQDTMIELSVWDTGIGIPSTDLSHIFERFYRVDKTRSRRLGGTGLGLAIVKHLVEGMGGRITVTSELGQGSTFTVTLPATATAVENPLSAPDDLSAAR